MSALRSRLLAFLLLLATSCAVPALAAEAIVNAGFEAGSTPWVESSTGGFPIVTTEDPFAGRVVRLQFTATNDAANVTSFRIDDVTLTTGASPPRIASISTRMRVLTGNDVMIAGFIIQGTGPKTVVVNVAGPSLASFGISKPLEDPMITLVRSSDGAVIASNDNWQAAANAAQIEASGLAPGHPLEPAIMMTLPPGGYTAIVQGVAGRIGVALVGVFAAP